jgi:hypothetical protein
MRELLIDGAMPEAFLIIYLTSLENPVAKATGFSDGGLSRYRYNEIVGWAL